MPSNINVKSLISDLKSSIEGEVRFDNGSRALYATDGSNYRQVPIGVVIPRTIDDVVQTVSACHSYGAPILSRGCGTSLAGQCCNTAVIIDFSKYLKNILEINYDEKWARVQPGVILDSLRDKAEEQDLTFGPDPATHNHCTLGGMMGNNSCGIHSVMAGKTVDNIEELEILTYDGLRMTVGKTGDEQYRKILQEGGRKAEIYQTLKEIADKNAGLIHKRYPDIPRRVSGFNLDDLLPEHGFDVAKALVGTESTCVVILEAKAKLVYSPPVRSLLVLGYPNVFQAGDHVPEIMEYGPTGLEGIDDLLVDYMDKKGMNSRQRKLLPEGRGWLLIEFGGEDKDEADGKARKLMEKLGKDKTAPNMKLFDDDQEETDVWEIRESGLGATAHIPGEKATWPGWEDAAIAPDSVGKYLRDFKDLLHKYDYGASLYGHFGQGCIHTRIPFDLRTADGIKKFRSFIENASDLVLKYNGSFSGEHGDGQSRGELLGKMFGKELIDAFRKFKSAWDPQWKMNPGKVIDPYSITDNLRLGIHYNPPKPETHFNYPEDHGDFSNAALRCVGVGKCRREGGGTMCPSFMVTEEEMHSTRGRARLLFEMLNGQEIEKGWRSKPVKDALELCLACKGCKNDCPVNVDMATYKAEFYSHFYKHRLRPVTAYSMGLIYWWAKIGSRIPGITNFFSQTPGFRSVLKFLGGIAPERSIPKFASKPFRKLFQDRPLQGNGRPRVILWDDTFNNNFHPETAMAAVYVLEKAGYQVLIPPKNLCCGRPLYDFGMLNLAKKLLRRILDTLKDEIEQGTPIVGLEPSCIAVFRDELLNLFPHDEDAKRLSRQTFMLSEFLANNGYDFPAMKRKTIVHGHCHHKAIMGLSDEQDVFKKIGLDFTVLDSGCCGMAGSFGFEKGEKYDVSVNAGERVLLPAVREAEKSTMIVADGFSCREQIRQLSDREALHFAEVLYLALQDEEFEKPEEVHHKIEM
ncbi:MAG: FAD-binding and (Fe-S)-binding domain-containing protein [Calditrichia bacterium]